MSTTDTNIAAEQRTLRLSTIDTLVQLGHTPDRAARYIIEAIQRDAHVVALHGITDPVVLARQAADFELASELIAAID